MYPQGKYTSGIDATSCSDCPSCDSGRWSNCTVIDAGSCVLCSQDTAPVVFLGPGLVRNASTAWSRSHNCTKVTLFQWGSWIQTMQKQCYDSLHLPNSCPWQCSDGYFKAFDAETRQEVCRPCSTSMCDVGEYRSNCTAAADGLCVPCTNTTLPANTGSMSPCTANLPCLSRCAMRLLSQLTVLLQSLPQRGNPTIATLVRSDAPTVCTRPRIWLLLRHLTWKPASANLAITPNHQTPSTADRHTWLTSRGEYPKLNQCSQYG